MLCIEIITQIKENRCSVSCWEIRNWRSKDDVQILKKATEGFKVGNDFKLSSHRK
jgi:hypothetical protein